MLRFKASRCLYAVEVTNTAHPGPNELKVSVVNTWGGLSGMPRFRQNAG